MEDKIVMALIEPTASKGENRITVLTKAEKERVVACYFTDELKFSEKEFIGLTCSEANDLYLKRDKAYIQS